MAHTQKPDFIFRKNGRVHLNRRGRQFSRLMAAEVRASAVVMLDTPCSEVAWRALATHSIRQFPLHFPSRASPCAITFQLDSTTLSPWKPIFRLGPCGFTEGQSSTGTQYFLYIYIYIYIYKKISSLSTLFLWCVLQQSVFLTAHQQQFLGNDSCIMNEKYLERSSCHLRYYQGHFRYPAPMQK